MDANEAIMFRYSIEVRSEMKRIIVLILSVLLIFAFCGCGGGGGKGSDSKSNGSKAAESAGVQPAADQKKAGRNTGNDDVPPIDGFEPTTTIDELMERFKKANPSKNDFGVYCSNYEWRGLKGDLRFEFTIQYEQSLSNQARYMVFASKSLGLSERELNDVYEKCVEAFSYSVEYYGLSVNQDISDDTGNRELGAGKLTEDGNITVSVDYKVLDDDIMLMFELEKYINR